MTKPAVRPEWSSFFFGKGKARQKIAGTEDGNSCHKNQNLLILSKFLNI